MKDTMINPEDDICYDLRPGWTEEEAVAKLLGWMQGARRIPNLMVTEEGIDIEQLPHILTLPCSLEKFIVDEREPASARFVNACVNGDFAAAQKWEDRVMFWDAIAERAARYKLAIQQELSRPNSKLIVDPDLTSQSGKRHITLLSLDQWARRTFGIAILDKESPSDGSLPALPKRPRSKMQESAILEAIQRLGFDPLDLPSRLPGKRGVKVQVRSHLKLPSVLFPSDKAFDKAWSELNKSNRLHERGSPLK
jgi:hypothetical protein